MELEGERLSSGPQAGVRDSTAYEGTLSTPHISQLIGLDLRVPPIRAQGPESFWSVRRTSNHASASLDLRLGRPRIST
jgi:hypothetical protein